MLKHKLDGGRPTRGMATWKAPEPVIQHRSRVLTYGPRNKPGGLINLIANATHSAFSTPSKIRVTSSKKIWPWSTDRILGAICDNESDSKRDTKTHPACIPFPKLATQ